MPKDFLYPSKRLDISGFWCFINIRKQLIYPNDKGTIIKFAAKLKICESEAAETLYWLQLLVKAELVPESQLKNLMMESEELVAIFTASTKTARLSASPRQRRG